MFEAVVVHHLRWRLQHPGASSPAPVPSPEARGEPLPFHQRDRRLFAGLMRARAAAGSTAPREPIPFRQQGRRLFDGLMRERAAASAEAPREALPFRQRDRRLFDALAGDAAELARPGALEAVAVRQRDRLMFDAMVARQGGKRVARRGAWTLGAAAFQVVFVTSLALLTALLAARSRPTPAVEVQLVRAAYRRPAPPPPPAAALAARRVPAGERPPGATVKVRPPAALIQPREIAEAMKAPDPGEPMEEYDVEYAEGVEGVVGGVPGYVPQADAGVAGGGIMEAPRYVTSGFRAPAESRPGCVGSSIRLPADLAGYAAGQVVVKFAVGRDGTIGLAQLMTPVPDQRIFQAIRQALGSCRWRAGSDAQGQPVTLWVILPLRFAAE